MNEILYRIYKSNGFCCFPPILFFYLEHQHRQLVNQPPAELTTRQVAGKLDCNTQLAEQSGSGGNPPVVAVADW